MTYLTALSSRISTSLAQNFVAMCHCYRKFCSCKDKFTFASSVVKQTNKQTKPNNKYFFDKQVIAWHTTMQVCCSVSSLGCVSIRASWITTTRLFPIITFISPVGSPVRLTGPFAVLSSAFIFSFCFLQINSDSLTRRKSIVNEQVRKLGLHCQGLHSHISNTIA